MDSLSETESQWGGDSNAEWMNLAAETIGLGTWEFDLEQGTGFMSERCAEIMGYPRSSPGQIIQLDDWLSRMYSDDRRRIHQACDPAGEGELQMRLQLIDSSGVSRQVLVRGRAFFSFSRYKGSIPVRKATRLLGIAQTLSDRQLAAQNAAEEERNRALAEAEAANRSKDRFLATLSHELRTPLNAILGWVFLMKQGSVKPELQKEGLLVIERNARAQSRLIADLLDISRIVAGKLRLEPQPLNFLSCVKSAMNNIRPSADEKGVRLVSRVDSSILVGIAMYGDPTRLEQVLLNLLVNAIKFTPANGRVEVSVEASESLIRLTVVDTGTGIEPEFLPRLFDRFSQADESLRKDRGLGLGLTISRHIVELHGGKIYAASDGLGKGASFTIELPVASVQTATQPEKLGFPGEQGPLLKKLEDVTVVAVDDNADALAFVDEVLRLHGAMVISVDTGAKAIEAVLRYHPKVVLCDLMMPEMDGYAVLRRIRKLDDEVAQTVPVVALTAFAGAENRLKTQQAGFQVHLDKPIDPPRLIETIQAIVRSQESETRSQEEEKR
jgi:signal transduction histidine kinase/CheY-like chemotaxis protein